MNSKDVYMILGDDWLRYYIENVTGQEVIKIEKYTFLGIEYTGLVKEFYTEEYSFRFYYIHGEVLVRDGLKRVVVNDLDELDYLVNKQFMEYFQI